MNIRKIVQRRIRHSGGGIDLVGDVNAAIAANVNERGNSSSASSRQRVVHRSGRTVGAESDRNVDVETPTEEER